MTSLHSDNRPVRAERIPPTLPPTAGASAAAPSIATSDGPVVEGFTTLPRAGIRSFEDAVLTLPSWYLDTTNRTWTLTECLDSIARGAKAVVGRFAITSMIGFANNVVTRKIWTKDTDRLHLHCVDSEGRNFSIVQFGSPFAWKKVELNSPVFMTVTDTKVYRGTLQVTAAITSERIGSRINQVIPMYDGQPGVVAGDTLSHCIDVVTAAGARDSRIWLAGRQRILDQAFTSEAELLAASRTQATNLAVLLRALHRPQSLEEARLARDAITRVAAAAVQARSRHFFSARPSSAMSAIPDVASRVATLVAGIKEQGITLTGDQLAVVRALTHAFAQPRPSAHMLNGDVGTGKTLAFYLPAIAAFQAGRNVAVLAPTGILADQLAQVILERFPGTPVARIEAGGKLPVERAILVGTPGLTSVCIKARWVPDVLVVDEEHKFGTEIREALVSDHTHVILATATPIPRSLAIALYTGLTQLVLKDVPRPKTIHTKLSFGEDRQRISAVVNAAIKAGRKIAFVYPLVEKTPAKPAADETEGAIAGGVATPPPTETAQPASGPQGELALPANPAQPPKPPRILTNIVDAYEKLNARFPGRVARLYGAMSDEEKRAEIDALKRGHKDLVVATSLVEVGLDIPGLDVMVVSDADRFGLSQLHQMRGRVGRQGGNAYFLMHLSPEEVHIDPYTVSRLRKLEQTSDGFELAEIDMDDRGFGDTAGDQQSGRVFMIVRGITLAPRDFLELAAPSTAVVHELADLTEDPEVAPVEHMGQLSLL